MKKNISLLVILIIVFVLFLLRGKKKEDYLVKINRYTLTMQRFESDFKNSAFAKNDTPDSRKEFLSALVKRKLILQYAQTKGLDKDKEFLTTIERFWEQSLLQRAIDQKNHEIAGSVFIPDSAIEAEYKKLQAEGKADKPYDEMRNQIRWSLTRAEQNKAMDRWITQLFEDADIKVNSVYSITNNIKE